MSFRNSGENNHINDSRITHNKVYGDKLPYEGGSDSEADSYRRASEIEEMFRAYLSTLN